jgi:WD40 repeat protein
VFISHTSELREFPKKRSYVEAVERAISAAGHVIVDMADFAAAGQAPAQVCAERVRGCDVYVGVLGTRYGSLVRDRPGVSYTELEFDAATEAGLDRLVFMLDTEAEDPGIPASALIDREFGARQDAFRRRVQESGLTTQSFASPAALSQLVERSLRDLADARQRREQAQAKEALAAEEGGAPDKAPRGAVWTRGCPYRGLLPFGESDADVFYGRERLAAELAVKLAARMSRCGMVVVTGASGSGKSSLLRAGLLPILAQGHQIPGSDRWPRVVMTPTNDPIAELAARLAAVGGQDALAVRDGLMQHPDQAHLAVRSAVLAAARHDEQPGSGDGIPRLVLIVDQFEQVFTLNMGRGAETARQAFITALCAAANPAGPGQLPPALVVIAVRGDFWDQCAAVPEMVSALQDGQFVVGPMTESELRVAITGPAEAAGLRIDPALTDTILGDLRAAGADRSAGVLPLLSQAMALTWEQRQGDRLTSHGYAQAGGVSHAVQTGADRAYGTLSAGQQTLAKNVLRSMTVASGDGGFARRPVTRDDLYAGLPGVSRPDIDAVLDAFAGERLAVLDGDKAQLSHDVLLRAWPRLRGWLEEDQASRIAYDQLADAAAAWQESRDDPSFLYRGTQLAVLRQAVTRWSANPARYPALTGRQREFLQASERTDARIIRRRRSSFVILAVLTVLAVAAAGFAFSQQASAIRQRDQAIYNQVVAEALQSGTTDTSLAAQLLLAAYRIQPTQDLASRLINTENIALASPWTVDAGFGEPVAFSPSGSALATSGSDGAVRLWGIADPLRPKPLGQPLTSTNGGGVLAFSRNGRTLAIGDGDGTIQMWDVADPGRPKPLGQPGRGSIPGIGSLAFSHDGRILASGGYDGTIRIWDVADPAHPESLGQPLISGGGASAVTVAFSPSENTLASLNGSGTIRLWDFADPAHPRPLGKQLASSADADSVAFSPDGRILASGGYDGTIRLWNVTDPAHPRSLGQPLTAGSQGVVVAFSPDGHTLASGGYDNTVRLWNVSHPAHPSPLGQLLAANSPLASVRFSPDGHTLATTTINGVTRLWRIPQTVLTSTGGGTSVAFSRDGHTMALGTVSSLQIFDTSNPARPSPLGQPLTSGPGVGSVAFSPRGHTLASGGNDGTIRLWDVSDPAHLQPVGQPLRVGGNSGVPVIFSPDGRTLASINGDGAIRLWDVVDPAHPKPLGQPLTASSSTGAGSVAFSPRGHILASGDYDGTVQLWNVSYPAQPLPTGQIPTKNSNDSQVVVAFSPDGHTLASGGFDGTVRLWDVSDPYYPKLLSQPLTGSNAALASVAFSADGHTLASGGFDGTVRLWDVSDPAHPKPLSEPLTGTNAPVFSVTFSPDGHTLASSDLNGPTQLWDLDVTYAIDRICDTAGGPTASQWSEYIPQLPYRSSCNH